MNPELLFSPEELTLATGAELLLGRSGRSFRGISTDSRTLERGSLFVPLVGKRFDGHDFLQEAFDRGAQGALASRWPLPGLSAGAEGSVWKVRDTLLALGNLAELHRRRFRAQVAAITGSVGKTTAKGMLHHALSGRRQVLATPGTQNNLVGLPLTLFELKAAHEVAVLEFGTNQWGEIARLTEIARPTLGVVTAIGPAHLETFRDLQGVLRAKAELWETMDSNSPLVLNADDPLLWEAGKKVKQPVVWFGFRKEAQVRAGGLTLTPRGSRCLINGRWGLELSVPGRHHVMNALAALACLKGLGEELPAGMERLRSFSSLAGRLDFREWQGCTVVDDSYNANPASLQAALEVLGSSAGSGRKILVLGDMLELGEQADSLHAEAGRWAAASKADALLAVGPWAGQSLLKAAWQAGFPGDRGWAFDTAESAGAFLIDFIRPGDWILVKGSRGMRMERVLGCSTISSIH
ncbi:MAG: UDP-N-acetylmuramoyl-tripeptide--D-alanyl-D-alanine ligase [Candidatus Omnitrophica bacterium]|nr:UDP-N-acetylmuramoyl-tripeptide--D-alanyl-D-alanine ligase [Candidatus Omnitrophota bacterium]